MNNNIGDFIIEKIGGHGKYQIILAFCLFFIGACSDFYYFYVPLMETGPIVEYILPNGEKKISGITYEICENYIFTVLEDKSKFTIFIDYGKEVYCSKWKASLFGASLCLGSIISTILLRFLKTIGLKTFVIISAGLMIITTPIIFIKNFWVQVVGNVIFGYANLNLFMLRNIIMTEVTDNKYRSYFMNANISTGVLCAIIYYYLFSQNFKYKYLYVGNAVVLLCILTIFILFTVEGPRFYLTKLQNYQNDTVSRQKLRSSIEYISKLNKNGALDVEELLITLKTNEINDENTILNSTELKASSDITPLDDDNYSPKLKLFNLSLIFFTFVFMMVAMGFEFKEYSNYLDFYFYIISLGIIFASYLVSVSMNISFMGRRYTIVICLFLMIVLKVLKLILDGYDDIDINIFAIIFLLYRLTICSCQIPIHTIVTESFNTKERIANYSFMYIFAKVAALVSPFTIEYMSKHTYDYTIITICSGIIFMVIFVIKETLNNSLKDL